VVTTKQKPTVDTQKRKRKEPKHSTTENYQITNEEEERKKERNYQIVRKQLAIRETAILSPYLSIL
jgi:hypothetical protein